MSCVGKCFGVIGSNLFFLGLVAMLIASFTNRWASSNQSGVIVNGAITDANVKLGLFDMTASIKQNGDTVFRQSTYTWCDEAKVDADSKVAIWNNRGTYCNLLLTTQASVVINLAFGLTAGVVAALLSAGAISDRCMKDVVYAAAWFMFVQFCSAVIAFACFFFISYKVNNDFQKVFPGVKVSPSYSAFLAVLCAGLVLMGFITTSIVGACLKRTRQDAAQALHLQGKGSSRVDVEAQEVGDEVKQGAQ